MRERGITEMEVEEALSAPLETKDVKFGRSAVCKQSRHVGSFLIVIVEADGEDFIVVTTMKVDRERANKLGFTGV